ncbi:MAG: ABC transporter permease, partial [Cyclobacteriaceae bacterium]|nr:ABC transporter permease [Cyclobacteriaceae bacterium]
LMQRYEKDADAVGEKRANQRLVWNTIRYFRLGILLRRSLNIEIKPIDMLSNYFKVMHRHLMRHKLQSAINLLGLTVGIAFALFSGIYIAKELTVNSDLKDVERIYLMESRGNSIVKNAEFFVPSLLAPEAKEQYPQMVEEFYRFFDREITVSKEDKHFRIQSMVGDSTFLQIFGFEVIYGDAQTALTRPNSIVITEKVAQQFFNRPDVTGQTLTIHTERSGLKEFEVTAVIKTPAPKNVVSDLANMNAQIFLPLDNSTDFSIPMLNGWFTNIITYVKLTSNCDSTQAQQMFNQLLQTDAPKDVSESMTVGMNSVNTYYQIANHSAVQKLLASLSAIVGLILLLAIANFINLSIANSFSRLKEIGLRQAIGGVRSQIKLQFLFESSALTICCGLLAIVLYEMARGYGGSMLNVSMPAFHNIALKGWSLFLIGLLLVGLLAGAYPALYLSSNNVVESLKKKLGSLGGTIGFTKGVISVQFVITFFVTVSAVVINRQVDYFLKTDLGYNKEHIITVSSTPRLWNAEGFARMETAKSEFRNVPEIEAVCLSWGTPNWNFSPYDIRISPKGDPNEQIIIVAGSGDDNYANVFGIGLIEGNFFNKKGDGYSPGTNEVVLNQTAKKILGYELGDVITFFNNQYTVVGVVEDFHFESLQEKIKPVVILNNKDFGAFRHFSFKMNGESPAKSIQALESSWKKIFPGEPFVFSFAEDRLKTAYKSELQLQKSATLATVLTSIIVVTGILGLVSLSLARRTKEIGIRRVLGATATDIQMLVTKEYLPIISIAFFISIPLAYWFMTQWLNSFAYRIELTEWMLFIPTLLLILVTLAIILIKSFKSALVNPVQTLKSE